MYKIQTNSDHAENRVYYFYHVHSIITGNASSQMATAASMINLSSTKVLQFFDRIALRRCSTLQITFPQGPPDPLHQCDATQTSFILAASKHLLFFPQSPGLEIKSFLESCTAKNNAKNNNTGYK